ncbi:MAG: hypothetical protein HFE63_06920 [Clostridiales bacterium]|nr:hypothetical protein [Clostridiales bacterium]
MKKFLTLALSELMLIATLTSFVAEDIGIKLNKYGTGSVARTVGIKEDYYNIM